MGLFEVSCYSEPKLKSSNGMNKVLCKEFRFSGHALRRMFERAINTEQVTGAVRDGEIIVSYPDDTPIPGVLLLGYVGTKPLHVVLAQDSENICQIITAYWPDSDIWTADFKTRRKS